MTRPRRCSRVVAGVERSRYAPPGATVTDIRTDTQTVVKAVSGVRRRKDRLRAAWWPTEGLLEWRERRAAVGRVLRRPVDRFQDWREARRDFRALAAHAAYRRRRKAPRCSRGLSSLPGMPVTGTAVSPG